MIRMIAAVTAAIPIVASTLIKRGFIENDKKGAVLKIVKIFINSIIVMIIAFKPSMHKFLPEPISAHEIFRIEIRKGRYLGCCETLDDIA